VRALKERLEARDGVPADLQLLRFGGSVVSGLARATDAAGERCRTDLRLPRCTRACARHLPCPEPGAWARVQLEDDALLSRWNIPNGATLGAQMRLRGGAAAKAKVIATDVGPDDCC